MVSVLTVKNAQNCFVGVIINFFFIEGVLIVIVTILFNNSAPISLREPASDCSYRRAVTLAGTFRVPLVGDVHVHRL